jgi:2,5-dihydroxypyridine 5,6-dioxygenase
MANRRIMMNPSAAVELVGLFEYQLSMCKLERDELCLVISDTAFNPVYSDACIGAALNLGASAYKQILPFDHPLPTKAMGAAWQEADLIVYMTTHKLHYHERMGQALENGGRILMAVQPLEVLSRLRANLEVIERTKAGARLLGGANRIRIQSEAGTDLVMERGDRPALAHYGVADESGHLDFWGAGMVETAQVEGTTEGRLVLDRGDANFSFGRYMESTVEIDFREGKITDVRGGLDALLLRDFLASFNDSTAFMAGHTSWGTDKRAQWHALIKAINPEPGTSGADIEAHYGNIQIELGSNNDINFKGKISSSTHLGLCCRNSSLWLDDAQVIDSGRFVPVELQ